jgi:hypothetical protein
MALIKCPDCSTEVSTEARNCPECGRPLRKPNAQVCFWALFKIGIAVDLVVWQNTLLRLLGAVVLLFGAVELIGELLGLEYPGKPKPPSGNSLKADLKNAFTAKVPTSGLIRLFLLFVLGVIAVVIYDFYSSPR